MAEIGSALIGSIPAWAIVWFMWTAEIDPRKVKK